MITRPFQQLPIIKFPNPHGTIRMPLPGLSNPRNNLLLGPSIAHRGWIMSLWESTAAAFGGNSLIFRIDRILAMTENRESYRMNIQELLVVPQRPASYWMSTASSHWERFHFRTNLHFHWCMMTKLPRRCCHLPDPCQYCVILQFFFAILLFSRSDANYFVTTKEYLK